MIPDYSNFIKYWNCYRKKVKFGRIKKTASHSVPYSDQYSCFSGSGINRWIRGHNAYASMWSRLYASYNTGEYYRIFTSMFLHFGPQHLGNNMLVLLYLAEDWNVQLEN